MTSFESIQVKIAQRERIFQQKQTSIKNAEELINPPKCFYHPDDQITFFCKNPRCTLPLCQKCLNIHRVEHLNRKEIPMQNVITFKECKDFALTQLKQTQLKIQISHQEFQAKLTKYKECLFKSIESTLIKLRDELYTIDRETSMLLTKQISSAFERISQSSSLTDIIKCYEHYYKNNEQQQLESNKNLNQSFKIDNVQFVVDQQQLAKVVQKGFLNCSFIRQKENVSTQRAKINCHEYLRQQRDSLQNINIMKSPINQLNQIHDISMQDFKNIQQHVKWQQNTPINEFPTSQVQSVIEVKRQERRSIFKQKEQKERENKPLVSKTISFNDFPSKEIKKQLQREPLFSAVKQYKIDNENENQQLGKKSNLQTKNMRFDNNTTPADTPPASRTHSNSSMKSRGKGISLVRVHPLQQISHIRQIQKQTTNIKKNRLKSQTNLREQQQVSFSRQSLGDWKRVVNLSDSNTNSSRQNKLSYQQKQNYHHKKIQRNLLKNDLQGFKPFKGIEDTDVLNPIEMRQLIMRKRNINSKAVENTRHLM